ncbi:MAG: hypothetical protein PHE19_08310 [Candidatus Cloacimonetes bacterium]|nr:hypothetical protein [Candidatus Cloacimonadota bacterium]
MAKIKATFTIDEKVLADIDRLCRNISMSKSSFLEHLIKESLATTMQLFSSDETLSEALVILSNQMKEIKEMMQDPKYLEFSKNLKEVRDGVQNNCNKVSV